MSTQIRILGIAPYAQMEEMMISIAKDYPNIELTTFVGDREAGLSVAKENFHGNYDAVISRGGTAALLKQHLPLPIISIELSTIDLLRTLRLAGGLDRRYAMVCAESMAPNVERLREVAELSIDIHPYGGQSELDPLLEQISRGRYDAVLCDNVAYTTARMRGMTTFLVTSSVDEIRSAFDQALLMCRSREQLRDENLFLRSLLDRQIGYTAILDDSGSLYLTTMPDPDADVLEMLRREIPETIATPERRITRNLNGMLYTIRTSRISIGAVAYSAFFFDARRMTQGVNHTGIRFFTRSEVERRYCESVFSIAGIPADSQADIDHILKNSAPVMIAGEAGTGKESAVDLIYMRSALNCNPQVVINCSILGEKEWSFLLEHHNSPLTDEGSTLYFSNVDSLSREKARQLVSVLDQMHVCSRNRVFFSCICARGEYLSPLGSEIADRLFCLTMYLPPLRELSGRIPTILNVHLSWMNLNSPQPILGMEPEAVTMLQQYAWPHNYAQFRRILNELVLTASGQIITADAVRNQLRKERSVGSFMPQAENDALPLDLNRPLEDITRDVVRRVVDETGGNQTAAAKRLGISRTTMWRILLK